ncbi:MAG: hypothetical protein HKO95_05255 [Rhodobacteraceae bacterium]|nr:hypothetical protein [Alphaproteobacteria bacterium]MBT8476735.1 hypothetical protein [Alphaproteobacteria bacterium]NNK66122.1 hypothetical protein [Paracoccaceae bacterium]
MLRLLGLGLFRRWITILLCVGAFWAGSELAHERLVARCLDAGGTVDVHGMCRGLR